MLRRYHCSMGNGKRVDKDERATNNSQNISSLSVGESKRPTLAISKEKVSKHEFSGGRITYMS